MNAFYGLLQKTRQRHGLPPQPRAFFAAIQRHVMAADRGWVVLARKGDLLVAGAIFLHSGSTAIYKYGASDDVHQALRGNNLLMGRALEWYAQAGFGGMDFGRTSLGNPGLRRFKLSWGTTERTLAYYHYSFRQSRFVPVVDKASGWHNAVFRRLPKILSQWIGQVLYKHID